MKFYCDTKGVQYRFTLQVGFMTCTYYVLVALQCATTNLLFIVLFILVRAINYRTDSGLNVDHFIESRGSIDQV